MNTFIAAETAIAAVKQHQSSGRKLEEVIFCCFDEENYELYDDLL
jgi:O-acetyl-ADP-ribose deacetylase (regulator of RNase III)